jgi:hypothetical protein
VGEEEKLETGQDSVGDEETWGRIHHSEMRVIMRAEECNGSTRRSRKERRGGTTLFCGESQLGEVKEISAHRYGAATRSASLIATTSLRIMNAGQPLRQLTSSSSISDRQASTRARRQLVRPLHTPGPPS